MMTSFGGRIAWAGALILTLACPTITRAQASYQPPTIDIPECNDYRIQNDPSLSNKQRACIYGGNLITPGAIFGAAFSAAYGQLTDDEPSWGHGTAGYAKRLGARYAQGASKATAEYLTAWALHEDPRRRPSNCIAWKRTLCAARSLFVQPKEGGGYRPVFATLAGAGASGFIGLSFYPDSGTVNESLRRSGTSLATSLLSVEVTEFQPDLLRWLGRRFSPKSTAQQAGSSSKAKP